MSEVGDEVMRAKLVVNSVTPVGDGEHISMAAVARDEGYPEDGSDEDNTYARFSPNASFELDCFNPALAGAIKPGERFYVKFIRAPDRPVFGS